MSEAALLAVLANPGRQEGDDIAGPAEAARLDPAARADAALGLDHAGSQDGTREPEPIATPTAPANAAGAAEGNGTASTGEDGVAEGASAALAMSGRAEGWAVAVSGGVDSMTLAFLAHRTQPATTTIYHARSAAVPEEATTRVERHAARHGWRLRVIDAGELADPRYAANPHDRCFWCKTNLYAAIARLTGQVIASGANVDDLGDFRPGLAAAADHQVRHPWIEAKIGKAGIRRIAADHGLFDLAELPASPCLSSRIETGIPVTVGALAAVDVLERRLHEIMGPATLRCRLRPSGIEIELDPASLARADRPALARLVRTVMRAHGLAGTIAFAPYRRGSAFKRPTTVPADARRPTDRSSGGT